MFYYSRIPKGKAPPGLKSLDLPGVADMIKTGKVKNIAFLTGAGVSVAAGIPDFRSAGGMYDTLRPNLLTATERQRMMMKADPTSVVSWDVFANNQFPYLELRRPFILGTAERKWKPTLAHWFVKVCDDKKLLRRLYTQNIDGLDYPLQIDDDKIVPVHGTMGKASCEFCGAEYPIDQFRKEVEAKVKDIYKTDQKAPKESTNILCLECNMPGVKPSTVLYGRSLPDSFSDCLEKDFPKNVDLVIVMGTSLTVSPANTVPLLARESCLRLVVNREPVGQGLGIRYGSNAVRDVFGAGDCDDVIAKLAGELGWLVSTRNLSPLSYAQLLTWLTAHLVWFAARAKAI
mmetsp:Transcript_5930/g.11880  ORF Transcript_5930/g.11880 Transcript_5930/m.11880 type:complete len:345 (-) Transcript_5930:1808-2842(-)